MSASPRAVFGVAVCNHQAEVRESIESLLGQTYPSYAVVVVDDCSTDDTARIVEEYAALDQRLSLFRNERRLGIVQTWQRLYRLARELYPDAEFFAWGSDHDLWHPRWLSALVEELDRNPSVVLAYPLSLRISGAGEVIRQPWEFETFGLSRTSQRFAVARAGMSAGGMIYGLFRVGPLARAGIYPPVLKSDRVLMAELSLYGEFRQVPEVLWYRRYGGLWDPARQRRLFFPDGAPIYAFLPIALTHAAALLWNLAVRGRGRPEVGRTQGLRLALWFLAAEALSTAAKKARTWRKRLRRRLDGSLPRLRRGVGAA